MHNPHIALVTGASRGIGAETVRLLAAAGFDVVINYRSKAPRAHDVATEIHAIGRKAWTVQADLTDAEAVQRMAHTVTQECKRLDLLILNASGGMEKDKTAEYGLLLNRDAQLNTVDALLPLMPAGSTIVFVTSHWAHFYGAQPIMPAYEPVASSKRAGEDALRARITEFSDRGIRLLIVSGDLIEGTITPKLLERQQRGLIELRREQAGTLPTIASFAHAIVTAALDQSLPTGHTTYVGSTE